MKEYFVCLPPLQQISLVLERDQLSLFLYYSEKDSVHFESLIQKEEVIEKMLWANPVRYSLVLE